MPCGHVPQGPTEELAGILWRERRLRLAEAAAYPVPRPADI